MAATSCCSFQQTCLPLSVRGEVFVRTTLLTWSVTSRNGQTSASVSLLLVTLLLLYSVRVCSAMCGVFENCHVRGTCWPHLSWLLPPCVRRDLCAGCFATMQTESDCRECCSNLLVCCLHYIVLPFHVWRGSAGLFNNSQSCKRRRSIKFKSVKNSHQRLKETDCRYAEVLFHLSAKSLGRFPQVLCLLSAKSCGRFPEVLFLLSGKSFGREICMNVLFFFLPSPWIDLHKCSFSFFPSPLVDLHKYYFWVLSARFWQRQLKWQA